MLEFSLIHKILFFVRLSKEIYVQKERSSKTKIKGSLMILCCQSFKLSQHGHDRNLKDMRVPFYVFNWNLICKLSLSFRAASRLLRIINYMIKPVSLFVYLELSIAGILVRHFFEYSWDFHFSLYFLKTEILFPFLLTIIHMPGYLT